MDKGKEETNKDVEKWDDALDGTWDFEVDNTTKDPSPDPTHISTIINLPFSIIQESPITLDIISSSVSKEG